jgi:hypothetical protein
MISAKNQTKICKPLAYQQTNLQRHLQFTKGIYKNEVQCKVKMQVSK